MSTDSPCTTGCVLPAGRLRCRLSNPVLVGALAALPLAAILSVLPAHAQIPATPAAQAQTAEPRRLYENARALAVRGEAAGARAILEHLAAQYPAAPKTADALLELGRLGEESLGDPLAALAAYERLIRDFPASRLVRRAQARIGELKPLADGDGKALAGYLDVLQRYAQRGPAASRGRMLAVIAAHPDAAVTPKALIWSASQAREARQFEDAETLLQAALSHPKAAPFAATARQQLVQVYRDARRFGKAETLARQMLASADPQEALLGRDALTGLAGERKTAYTVAAALFALALFAALALAPAVRRRAWGALPALPPEVRFFLPVAALLVWLAYDAGRGTGRTVALFFGIYLAVLWLHAAWQSAAPAGRVIRLSRTAFALGVSFAAFYLASEWAGMTDMILETLTHGPSYSG